MNNDNFVKIENKTMPIDNFKDINLEIEKNSQSGFTSFLFLSSIVVTTIMWVMLMFLGK